MELQTLRRVLTLARDPFRAQLWGERKNETERDRDRDREKDRETERETEEEKGTERDRLKE